MKHSLKPESLIGIGLRHSHFEEILKKKPKEIGWLEIHAENFFGEGGRARDFLEKLSGHYPMSIHGVGLSLGSPDLSKDHLKKLKDLVDKYKPFLVSEHLSWSRLDPSVIMNDLLPLPYTNETLQIIVDNIKAVQDYLGRKILVENPSSYLKFSHSSFKEYEFISEICSRTECGLLLDVNNIFVSCSNNGGDPKEYLDAIPSKYVEEIHLAGHSFRELPSGRRLRVDTHNNLVCKEVWELYRYAVEKIGPVPSLIEWDLDVPELRVLLDEVERTRKILEINKSP